MKQFLISFHLQLEKCSRWLFKFIKMAIFSCFLYAINWKLLLSFLLYCLFVRLNMKIWKKWISYFYMKIVDTLRILNFFKLYSWVIAILMSHLIYLNRWFLLASFDIEKVFRAIYLIGNRSECSISWCL